MLENLRNSKCCLPHESQKVLIYFKDINLSNEHNYLWLKVNNHWKMFADNLAYKCIFQNCLLLDTRFLYQIFFACREVGVQDIFKLPKYDLLQVMKIETIGFLLNS